MFRRDLIHAFRSFRQERALTAIAVLSLAIGLGATSGAASLLDFLDAARSYRATQLAYRQALASYQLALEQLREAVGTRSLP